MEELLDLCGAIDFVVRFGMPVFSEWLGIVAKDGLRYIAGAGGVFLLLYVLLGRRLAHRRIQDRPPPKAGMRREIYYSAVTTLVFATVGTGTHFLVQSGATRFYTDIAEYGLGYLLFCILAALVIQDAYFYWTHRVMHHPRLFRLVHKAHHKSVTPSPWAAYAFGPIEAAVHAFIVPILVLIMPMHPVALFVFLAIMMLRNALGHAGIEIFPRGIADHPLLGLLTTNTHHDLHHSRNRGNYGFYFTWWDRLMGTEYAGYRQEYRRVTDGRTGGESARRGAV